MEVVAHSAKQNPSPHSVLFEERHLYGREKQTKICTPIFWTDSYLDFIQKIYVKRYE
jgi:hypothetical protein